MIQSSALATLKLKLQVKSIKISSLQKLEMQGKLNYIDLGSGRAEECDETDNEPRRTGRKERI
jgi:hypothetical protein